jgi:GntR family transcriptional regulator
MNLVDKTSAVPYYKQLADLLRHEINQQRSDGQLYQLPSENELAERHGLSRATVRHALAELEGDGWIYREKGIGSFAPVRRVELELTQLVSTSEDMTQRGWVLVTKVLDLKRIAAPPQVGQALELRSAASVFELSRLRLVNSTPLSLQTAFLPAALCPKLEQDDLTGSLYRLLETRYGIRLWTGRETLRARRASAEEAKILDIDEGTPVLYAERITYSASGQPVEYLEAVWRGDRYDFKVTLARTAG